MGLWFGYPFEVTPNDGIARFTMFLLESLLKNDPSLKIEIWSFRINKKHVERLIPGRRHSGRVSFHFEPFTWKVGISEIKRLLRTYVIPMPCWLALRAMAMKLSILPVSRTKSVDISQPSLLKKPKKNGLIEKANASSRADFFWIPFLYSMCDAVYLNKPKIAPMYDFFLLEFAEQFREFSPEMEDANNIFLRTIKESDETLFFSFHSDHIRKQGKRYIGTPDRFSDVIHLPVFFDSCSENDDVGRDEKSFRKKYGISGDYAVYPTQFRPHKNFDVLFQAFTELRKTHPEIRLLLTCRNVSDVHRFTCYDQTGLDDGVLFTGVIDEKDMKSLHRYARMVLAPSLAEGGFPAPAFEAAAMKKPFVLARIPVAIERLRSIGVAPEESGIVFFEPNDPHDFAEKMRLVLENPGQGIMKNDVFNAIMKRTWDDLANEYFAFFEQVLEKTSSDT